MTSTRIIDDQLLEAAYEQTHQAAMIIEPISFVPGETYVSRIPRLNNDEEIDVHIKNCLDMMSSHRGLALPTSNFSDKDLPIFVKRFPEKERATITCIKIYDNCEMDGSTLDALIQFPNLKKLILAECALYTTQGLIKLMTAKPMLEVALIDIPNNSVVHQQWLDQFLSELAAKKAAHQATITAKKLENAAQPHSALRRLSILSHHTLQLPSPLAAVNLTQASSEEIDMPELLEFSNSLSTARAEEENLTASTLTKERSPFSSKSTYQTMDTEVALQQIQEERAMINRPRNCL